MNATPIPDQLLYRPASAALVLGTSVRTVYRLLASERLSATLFEGVGLRIHRDELMRFASQTTRNAPTATEIARVFHAKLHQPETGWTFEECCWWPCSELNSNKTKCNQMQPIGR